MPALDRTRPRILCATDLWARSDFALRRTLSLVEASGAKSLLLHVVDGDKPLRLAGRMADRAHNVLAWRVRQWGLLAEPPEISVRVGQAHRLVARVAQDWRADLIVLGAYRPRLADWLLGTTAERLVAAANSAVLIVNTEPVSAYSEVTFAAASVDSAGSLVRIVSGLGVAHPVQSQYRTLAHPRFGSVARALVDAGSDLIVTDLERLPQTSRMLGRNLANALVRRARCDVLIASTGSTGRRKPGGERLGASLRTASEPVA